MKNVKNKLIFVLTSAMLASGLTVGASAQVLVAGTSGPGNSVSWNTILSNAGNSSYLSGSNSSSCPSGSGSSNSISESDLKSLLGNLYSNCPSSQVSDSTTVLPGTQADTAGTSQAYQNPAKQSTSCPTGKQTASTVQSAANQADSASAPDKTAVSAAENTPVNEKSVAVKKAVQETQNAAVQTAAKPTVKSGTVASPATDTTSAPTSSSCNTPNQQAAADTDTVRSSGNTLMQRINRFLIKCGFDLNSFGINLPGCENTTESAVPSSEEANETAQQSNAPGNVNTTTPAPSNTTVVNQNASAGGGQSDQAAASSGQSNAGSSATQNADSLSFEEQVAALVNEQRAANGLQPLTLSSALSNAARTKSQDMHDNHYFAHESPTYGSPFEMLTSFGISYRTAGENIAMGYATPEAVMNAWMNSPGHRANILNANYKQIGVGYVENGNYWTQEFTG